jgi:SsrA-binding protein
MRSKIITQAKKNFRDYKIIEKYQAALELKGGDEIKSIRNQQVSLNGAYILPQKSELYIINMAIAAYRYSHNQSLAKTRDTRRKRKLLLERKEINKLIGAMKAKKYMLIPLQLFITEKG